jgi:hypothetical protein
MRSWTSPSADGLSRRGVLVAAAALLAGGPATAQSGPRFGRIVIDVAPLVAKGLGGGYAERVRQLLTASFAKEFAGLVGGSGPTLVVQIKSISMSSFVDGGGAFRWDSGGGPGNDYMDGTLITQSGKTVLSRVPMLGALTATSGGAWYLPDNEDRRLKALSDFYAYWSRRKLGL